MDRRYLKDDGSTTVKGEYFSESNPPDEVLNIDINDLMTGKNGLEMILTE